MAANSVAGLASKRSKKSQVKLKSSDGEVFEVDHEIVADMETLKTMTMFEEEEEEVPICSVNSQDLKKVLVWTEYQNYFKDMSLRDTFKMLVAADYLENESLLQKMFRNVFCNYSFHEIDNAAEKFEDAKVISLLDNFKRSNKVYEVLVTFHRDKLRYFDFKNNQWMSLTEIPNDDFSLISASIISAKNNIYLFGFGYVMEYNPRTKIWRNLPIYTDGENFCSIGNKIYSIGSESKVIDLDDEDPRWSPICSPKNPNPNENTSFISKLGLGLCTIEDTLYMVGETSIEKYEVKQNLWSDVTEMPTKGIHQNKKKLKRMKWYHKGGMDGQKNY